ncbi:MAG: helix-turn-helix transcriptional regulator [Balneolaceae bacterium]
MSELARRLEMKPQALTKYVKGESMPGGLILIRLYKLGVNINWFLTGEGPRFLNHGEASVSEPFEEYVDNIELDRLNDQERKMLDQLLFFSGSLKKLDISTELQRALLLVFTSHMNLNSPEEE